MKKNDALAENMSVNKQFTLNEILIDNKKHINEVLDYNHILRSDLISHIEKLFSEKTFKYFMEKWETWITNPLNEFDYVFKIHIPFYFSSNSDVSCADTQNHFSDSYCENYIWIINTDDFYLEDHKTIIQQFNLKDQYDRRLIESILIITRRLINEYLKNYDIIWINIDNYDLLFDISIKYKSSDTLLYDIFTGLIISLKLTSLVEKAEKDMDLHQHENKCWCF